MIKLTPRVPDLALTKIIISGVLFFISLPVLSGTMSLKKGDSASMNIHMTGTVVVKESCEILDPINIEFNDVYIEEINSKVYKKNANYKVRCPASSKDKTIKVRFSGLTESYDPSLFSTDINGLSVKLLNDGKQISPGQTTTLYTDNSSQVDVELTKKDGINLPEREFNAVIILTSNFD